MQKKQALQQSTIICFRTMVFPFFEMTHGFKPFTVLWYFHCRKNCITASSYNDSLEYLTFLFFQAFVDYQWLEMALTLLGISLDQKDLKAFLPLKFTYYDREIMYIIVLFLAWMFQDNENLLWQVTYLWSSNLVTKLQDCRKTPRAYLHFIN